MGAGQRGVELQPIRQDAHDSPCGAPARADLPAGRRQKALGQLELLAVEGRNAKKATAAAM